MYFPSQLKDDYNQCTQNLNNKNMYNKFNTPQAPILSIPLETILSTKAMLKSSGRCQLIPAGQIQSVLQPLPPTSTQSRPLSPSLTKLPLKWEAEIEETVLQRSLSAPMISLCRFKTNTYKNNITDRKLCAMSCLDLSLTTSHRSNLAINYFNKTSEAFTYLKQVPDQQLHSKCSSPIGVSIAVESDESTKSQPGCVHYKRKAMFVTPCCNKFYNCRFCHDKNESHHFERKSLTELICSECNTRQSVRESCQNCGVRFGMYTCLICNLFDDTEKQQYHCHGCGICRIGGAENFFHCEVCNMCLPIRLKIDGHRCVENVSRSHCPVCLGDIHTSRIPCHIPDCGHLLHKMCFDQLLASGHYTCPTCQTSLIDMTALWDYLDIQSISMPVPKKYENQRIHIFCNDCHKTSKTKFHFIGLKCSFCGAYNTTQDVKRRMSLNTDEPTSA